MTRHGNPGNWRGRLCRSLLLASCLALPGLALAQTAQPPSRDDLGVSDPLNSDLPRRATVTVEGGIERGPCPLADPAYANVTVNFGRVEFTGLPGISPDVLGRTWTGLAGQPLPIARLCGIRDEAATLLRAEGFLAAVQVPPQRIEAGGTVRMDVLAARLVEVQLRGDAGNSEDLIAAHVGELTEREFFNVKEAERHLLLMQDLPGFDVRLTLRPANRGPGQVVGDIVIERTPFEFRIAAHNLASRVTGREGAFAEFIANDLTGMGDRTRLSYYNTIDWDEQRVLELGHDFAVGTDGLRLGANLLYGESEPGVAGGAFASETMVYGVHAQYPLIRRQTESLVATGGIEAVNQQLDFGGVQLSEDDLRILFARLDYSAIDPASLRGFAGYTPREPRWQGSLSLELRQGINGFGASDDCDPIADCLAPNIPLSNFLADPAAGTARIEGVFEYRPRPNITLAMTSMAQIATDPLLAYEQVSLGNFTIGRGYDPGSVLGDHAVGSSIEVRVGRISPLTAKSVSIQPFAFVDYAKAWLDDDVSPDPRRIVSAGAGMRGKWGYHSDFGFTLAKPLRRTSFQTEKGDLRLLFTFTTRLIPWGRR